jgi:hypothetical protein
VRVWPGDTYTAHTGNYSDDEWHTFTLTCLNEQDLCTTTLDGEEGEDCTIGYSEFNWANRINLGYSVDTTNYFTGQMRNITY